jgi:hypothetical protein
MNKPKSPPSKALCLQLYHYYDKLKMQKFADEWKKIHDDYDQYVKCWNEGRPYERQKHL